MRAASPIREAYIARPEKRAARKASRWKTISCGGESWHACGAFCAPAFADPFPISSFPRQSPSFFKMDQPNKLATIRDCSVDLHVSARVGGWIELRETHHTPRDWWVL